MRFVQWEERLRAHRLVYQRPARFVADGLPLGNGDLGATAWIPDHMQFDITKLDVWDYRQGEHQFTPHADVVAAVRAGDKQALRDMDRREMPGSRYPVPKPVCQLRLGYGPAAAPAAREERQGLDLLTASLTNEVQYTAGRVKVSAIVCAHTNVLLLRVQEEGQLWVPDPKIELFRHSDLNLGCDPETGHDDRHLWVIYRFPDGFVYAAVAALTCRATEIGHLHNVAYCRTGFPESSYLVALGVATNREGSADPLAAAREKADAVIAAGWDENISKHKERWWQFWDASAIQVDDPFFENVYALQMYQLGATLSGPIAPGLFGLWAVPDPAPWHGDYHGDVNIEMLYWPVYSANRAWLANSYEETYLRMLPAALEHARETYGITTGARFPVASGPDMKELAHTYYRYIQSTNAFLAVNFWWRYLYTLDTEHLGTRIYPFLKAAAGFYEGYLTRNEAGIYDIVPSFSPEQGPQFSKNPTFDISLIKLLFGAVRQAAQTLDIDHERQAQWAEIATHLPEYPVQDGVFLDSEWAAVDTPLAHPSLLGPVFPAGEVGPGHALARVARRTLERALYQTWRLPWAHELGWNDTFSWVWLSIVAARFGLGDRALHMLTDQGLRKYLKPNGLFAYFMCLDLAGSGWEQQVRPTGFHTAVATTEEGRARQLCFIESAGGFCMAVHEMLLQSYDGVIRVFPAVPSAFSHLAFDRLRALGAFLVSARMVNRQVTDVVILSEAGGECRVLHPDTGRSLRVYEGEGDGQPVDVTWAGKVACFHTVGGSTYRLEIGDTPASTTPKALTPLGEGPRCWTDTTGMPVWLGRPARTHS